jgi:hypothetical protein
MAPLQEFPYNREAAAAYANRWAFQRNPRYFDFSKLGGNCTNFASQCIYAGSGVMNYKPTYGWYYNSSSSRSPSWTGVVYLYNFLIGNKGAGPYGIQTSMDQVLPGDIAQLSFAHNVYSHTPVIVEIQGEPTLDHILIAANTFDANRRPLSSYEFQNIRFVHIAGVRK